ncbi:MAG: PilC/PilY family type IV pilus protein [Steroidobacteraceae bacterium]|jgi:type IV pilus assembly protein PilY1|nr:PilC/PilY family type IV pilus protein [Steroidobacteraceae bacterium]
MKSFIHALRRASLLACVGGYVTVAGIGAAQATPMNLIDTPLYLNQSVAPMNMLVMGRDHKLFYEAYNDASDLNNDGVLDVGYKPDEINYYGNFDSFVCYDYDAANEVFRAASLTTNKKCTGRWSGDFLNYLTTSRIDALRKVFYGGSRHSDPDDEGEITILRRANIPQDAHSWGKEYESPAVDGYSLTDYTPLALPTAGSRHWFGNVTLLSDADQKPRLRVRLNQTQRIWEWASTERPVLRNLSGVTDYIVRNEACVEDRISAAEVDNCRRYPDGTWKPIGLLQRYGENDTMLFGLLTGNYSLNTQGGSLRRNMGSIRDEINADTGQFESTVGIILTIDRMRIVDFGGSHAYSCGWITTRPINAGECRMWGNPVGEMLYEAVRYFAGRAAPTSTFSAAGYPGSENVVTGFNLPLPAWQNPYTTSNRCAKPFMTVVSDINPSYDADAVPGMPWNTIGSGDLTSQSGGGSLNAGSMLDIISNNEPDVPGMRFIGESLSNPPPEATYDGAPTPKLVDSLKNLRGLSPEEPTKQGSFSSAGVAFWANTNDVNPIAGSQRPQTFAVALASPLPRIEIPFDNGKSITLVPFAKSVGGSGISEARTAFQPTNQIVDFYYDRLQSDPPNSYFFRVNYEDVEQGADHDMDAIVEYDIDRLDDDRIRVRLRSTYAAGGIIQHMGYIVSGTDGADGIYLTVRDVDTSAGADRQYFLDVPPGQYRDITNPTAVNWNDGVALPLESTQEFRVGASPGAELLRDPLYYAAKWGGFVDGDGDKRPFVESEWNQDGDAQGVPDNYFVVTNAARLSEQLSNAFDTIVARSTSASSVALNSGSLSSDTRVFQAKFNSGDWTGQLLSFKINTDGTVPESPEWGAAEEIPEPASRTIITVNDSRQGIPFRWDDLDATFKSRLQPLSDALGDERLEYLRGDNSREVARSGGIFRNRRTPLGDIISSSPQFVGAPRGTYRDSIESARYSEFKADNADRTAVIYAGANDGMLHGFRATDGAELLAFVPRSVSGNLHLLTSPSYVHKFYVDGTPTITDAFVDGSWRTILVGGLNQGGQGVYALDVTDPSAFAESNADDVFLWEFDDRATDDRGDPDLGLTFSRPVIVKLNSGRWAAIFGNGYNNTAADGSVSTTGNAVLYIVDLETGKLIRKIDTGVGFAQDPTGLGRTNGLASPAVVDTNGDAKADVVYAGDLFGNLWKFDLRFGVESNWGIPYTDSGVPAPLFRARNADGDPQPITSRPNVSFGPRGQGLLVLFGTGKYLEPTDKEIANLRTQTFYGLHDRNSMSASDRILTRDDLVEQQILREASDQEFTAGTVTSDYSVRVTTANTVDYTVQRGWFMDLQVVDEPFQGEMQVSESVLRAGRVVFTTLIPSPDPCEFGGTGWLMSLDAESGGRAPNPQFDLNFDGQYDDADRSLGDVVSGLKSEVGIVQRPGVLADNQSGDFKLYVSGTSGENPGGVGNEKMTTGESRPEELQGRAFATGRQSWRQVR